MKVIVGHHNMDFDCFASMIAARKLYPDAILVAPGKLSADVEEFQSLHKDIIDIKKVSDIAWDKVDKLIVVDTSSIKRLGKLSDHLVLPYPPVVILDHHEGEPEGFEPELYLNEHTGAAVTLIARMALEAGLDFTPLEATIVCIGIHTDTGSLTYSSTTSDDAMIISRMIGFGAKLEIVREFIDRSITQTQDFMIRAILEHAVIEEIRGHKLLISSLVFEEYSEGLAAIIPTVLEYRDAEAAFILAQMGGRVFLIGRSKEPGIDVGKILALFGGGGHPGAGSASVKGKTLEVLDAELREQLAANIENAITAADLMSSPVITVSLDTPVSTASGILFKYGHTGLPVLDEDGKLAGIISRRDIEKAVHHGLSHAPVRGYMTRNVVSIDEDTPIAGIRNLIVEKDIGRLPVIKDGKLLGIVTRTDVLKTMHGFMSEPGMTDKYNPPSNDCDVKEQMQGLLSIAQMHMLEKIGEIAEDLCMSVFLVGGFVRDIFLQRANHDIDIVVCGDGMVFARKLAEVFAAEVKLYPKFRTATLTIGEDGLDIVSARKEFYACPAALPEVERGSIYDDLIRRDFSINAMALAINPSRFGMLIDPFHGKDDLEKGIIRVMHNLSFIEDPTRILRAVRFSQRLAFSLEHETQFFLREAIANGVVNNVSSERWRDELLLLLREGAPFAVMQELGIWSSFATNWCVNSSSIEAADAMENAPEDICVYESVYLARLICALLALNDETALDIINKLKLTRVDRHAAAAFFTWRQENIIDDLYDDFFELPRIASGMQSISLVGIWVLYSLLKKTGSKQRLQSYIARKKSLRLCVKAQYLLEQGMQPGPCYREVLEQIRLARLDGLVGAGEAEFEYARNIMKKCAEEVCNV